MRFRKLMMVVLAAAVPVLAAVTPASATQQQMCGSGGSGWCMQDFGGGDFFGDAVTNYYGSSSYENFYFRPVSHCYDPVANLYYDTVQAGYHGVWCPFATHALDTQLQGTIIGQVYYAPGGCVGTEGVAFAGAGINNCGDTIHGNGGSNGVIQVLGIRSDCNPGGSHSGPFTLIDRYWSDYYASEADLNTGAGKWSNDYWSTAGSGSTCWGSTGSWGF